MPRWKATKILGSSASLEMQFLSQGALGAKPFQDTPAHAQVAPSEKVIFLERSPTLKPPSMASKIGLE